MLKKAKSIHKRGQNKMDQLAEKAYEAYKRTAKMNFVQVTTAKLNVIYNIQCRIKREEEYRLALEAFKTEEGVGIAELIENYFNGYNARHGLEIRDTLIEFEDPTFADGGYFIISSYKKDGDTLTECDPTAYSVGDTAHIRATLFSHAEGKELSAVRLHYTVRDDDGNQYEGVVTDSSSVEFDLTLTRPGWSHFKVFAEGADEKPVLGMETAHGGVLFDFRKIGITKEVPSDLISFWEGQIDRLLEIDPTDTVADDYNGSVAYEYDMPKENRFELIKFDGDYIKMLKEYGIGTLTEEHLERYDIYEVNLKAPGPCHSSNYLSIPKNAEKSSLPLIITYDGYSAYPPAPVCDVKAIRLHCSHHGYKLPRPLKDYYMKLRTGVCKNYGLGNGVVNSLYEDLTDNYMVYLHLRNLQAMRFVTSENLSGMIPRLHDVWCGDVSISGGSMGGYQAICESGLSTLLVKKTSPFKLLSVTANVPAFCNLAGRADGRVPGMTYYTEGMEYFDAAHLSSLVNAPLSVPRVGLGDITCPPNGICAMLNNLPSSTTFTVGFLQNSNHGYVPEPEVQKWSKYSF